MAAPAAALSKEAISKLAAQHIPRPSRNMGGVQTGLVVSAGLMDRTVKIRLWGRRFEKKIMKHFSYPTYHLVHDPRNSVRDGDVITVRSGWKTSRHKRHIVRAIVAPYGIPIEDRPPVPTDEELFAEDAQGREQRNERRAIRDEENHRKRNEERAAKRERRLAKEARIGGRKTVEQEGGPTPQETKSIVETSLSDVD